MPASPGGRRVSSANIGSANHLGDRPMRHINAQKHMFDVGRRLLVARPMIVLSFGLVLWVTIALIFAVLFLICGESCYTGHTHFNFATMFYLSIHTFSTVGYGTVAPNDTCALPQILMLIESYISLMITAGIGGYVFTVFVRSRPRLRFSDNILVTRRGKGNVAVADVETADVETFLTFRIITAEVGSLRDVHVRCQAALWRSGGDGSFNDRNKGRVETLKLEQDYFTSIEQLQLYHLLDAASPLHEAWQNESLQHHVEGIDIALSAFDTKTGQDVKVFKHYDKLNVVENASFDVMFEVRAREPATDHITRALPDIHSPVV